MKKKLLAFGVAGLLMVFVASMALAEIEFSVGGHFRTLSYYVANPDLKEGGPERSYTEQCLILNPVLKLSDAIQVKARLRALDYIWGDNTVPGLTWGPMIRTDQGDSGTNNFQWDRAWVQIGLGKYGSIQIGRQQTDLFHNFSIASDDTYPRYHYITPVFALPGEGNIMFGMLYDKRAEGDIDKVVDGVANDSFAWCPWVFFWNPKLTIGYVCFVWNRAGQGPNGESGDWIMHDAMINATIGPVEIKSEWDYDTGEFVGLWQDHKDSFEFFVDAGVPLTTPVVNRAAVVVALFSGTKPYPTATKPVHSGSLGSNEDWVDEWKIDMILWDQLYNTIYNAWIIRPKVDFVIPNTKFGGFLSACLSFADKRAYDPDTATYVNPAPGPAGVITLTTGTEKTIGTEIDLGINYTLGPRQTIELVLGYFAPGKYFDASNRDGTLGAALKTHIWF
jgi:hypothetical protein